LIQNELRFLFAIKLWLRKFNH